MKSPIFIILSPLLPITPHPTPHTPLPRYCMGKMQKEKKLQPKR
ncbi:hypothetical protein O53_1969 [Microcystis aeruginosa TAIHU98]|uniref:Uncharacterized protein n=1 Tax=Microcystis aeruginosa TAIHU98 TaxID=1134457 RepID=L7ED15_MICAE|nr:hypothetical protein O53_1969 [Microcystis aeruginosa TAIHU98]ODV36711.1 hypothetical protein BFG60_3774 [Microcystis aeruginosa NIES-98]